MSKTEQYKFILIWRKPSYSIASGSCVEAAATPGAVTVRDTVNPAGDQLWFTTRAWREFTSRIRGA